MRKAMTAVLALTAMMLTVGCQEKLEDRAERECREQTEKNCPTPVENFASMDSMTFERSTHTIVHHYSVYDRADDSLAFVGKEEEMHRELAKVMANTTEGRIYKDAGYNYRFIYRSHKDPQRILYSTDITPKDYK